MTTTGDREDGGTGAHEVLTIPDGFKPTTPYYGVTYYGKPFYASWDKVRFAAFYSGAEDLASCTFLTDDAWPTSLPGSAA